MSIHKHRSKRKDLQNEDTSLILTYALAGNDEGP